MRNLLPLVLLPLSGCSALMVGELGYAGHLNGQMNGIGGAIHSGFGTNAPSDENTGVAAGAGLSFEFRAFGAPYSAIEPGIHGYVMMDRGPLSFYLRGIAYTGLTILPEHPGIVFSPTLQPGFLVCPDNRLGLCMSLSAPIGYDIAPAKDKPGLTYGLSLGIGWGNVVDQHPNWRLR